MTYSESVMRSSSNQPHDVIVAGGYRTAQVNPGRNWWNVHFEFGISVRVNPDATFDRTSCREARIAAMKAAEAIENLSMRRLQPLIDYMLSGALSTQEMRWLCGKLNCTKAELRKKREVFNETTRDQ